MQGQEFEKNQQNNNVVVSIPERKENINNGNSEIEIETKAVAEPISPGFDVSLNDLLIVEKENEKLEQDKE